MHCRLKYSSKGFLTIAGFSKPKDADADDIELWYPQLPGESSEEYNYVINKVGCRAWQCVDCRWQSSANAAARDECTLETVFHFLSAVMEPALDIPMAKYVIEHVGDRFCELVQQEKMAMSWVKVDSE